MRVGLRLAPFLFVITASAALAQEIEEIAETRPENFAYVAATRPDRIGRVMAPVFVNGVGPFAFIVDTGASRSVIAPRLAARLKLVADPSRAKLLRGITGSEIVPSIVIDRLVAGNIELTASELPLARPRVFADADGIFGADAFARGCLHVDFGRARVSILNTACPRVGRNWESLRAELRFGGLAVVRARVANQRVIAIVDTGAERSLGNQPLLEALGLQKLAELPESRTQVFAATSQAVYGNVVATPSIRMGTVEIGNLNVVFGDFDVFRLWGADQEPAIVLGMDILGTTQGLMVDYQRSEVRLLPQGEQNVLRPRDASNPSRVPQ